jgi:hypothetical protein
VAYSSTKHVNFDGSSERVDMGDVLDFERTDSFSISFWCRFTSTSAMTIVSKMGGASDYKGFQVYVQSHVRLQLVSAWSSSNQLDVRTTTTIHDGNWHHVLITYGGTSTPGGCHIYIDDTDEALTTVTNNLTASITTANTLQFGDRSASGLPYTGDLDEMAIWDAELTSGEVTAVYNSGVPNDLTLLSTASDLVGWWKMGDGDTFPTLQDSGVAGTNLTCPDLSTSGNDGTPTNMESGDVSSDVAGGRASTFNGTDEYVTMGNVLAFEYTDDFSISFWFKSSTSGGYFVCKQNTTTYRGYGVALTGTAGIDLWLRNDNGSSNAIHVETTASGLNDGAWHHVVATWAGNASPVAADATLYVDGVADTSVLLDNLSATLVTTAPLNIAARNNGTDAFRTGEIDDVAIYDAELSSAEVTAIYNSGSPNDLRGLATAANLVGYWRMGDGATSPTIPDVLPQYEPLTTSIYLQSDAQTETVQFASPLTTPNTQAFTMGVWIKRVGGATERTVMCKCRVASEADWMLRVHTTGIRAEWQEGAALTNFITKNGLTWNDGNWHLLLMTFDGGGTPSTGTKLYWDGALQTVGGGNHTISRVGAVGNLTVGGLQTGASTTTDHFYQANVCHEFLYDKELSAAEVATIYGGGIPQDLSLVGPTSNLKHWCALGDGDAVGAGNMIDLSTSGIDGEFVNGESGDFLADVPTATGNDGTMTNMDATNFVDGAPGGFSYASFDFDGVNEYVTMGNVLGLEYNQAFSFSCWAKTSASGSSQILLAKEGDLAARRGYKLYLNSSGLFVVQLINDAATNLLSVNTTATFNDGLWHHLVMTKSTASTASGIALYVDGSAETTATGSDTLSATLINSNELWIGASDSSGGLLPFTGNIDEVLIYDVELTAGQVADLYAFGAPVDPTALGSWSDAVGYWRMGEASFDGTMTGMAADDIVEGGGPGWEWGSVFRGRDQPLVSPIFRPAQFPTQEHGRYPVVGVFEATNLDFIDAPAIRAPIKDPLPPSLGTVTLYFKMRGVDDNGPNYTTWVATENSDPDGDQATGANTTPALVGSIVAASGVVLDSWEQ